ncbi:MAG: peptidoglycan DD-metalloendopeptidase family protein [Breznakibacter sp.]
MKKLNLRYIIWTSIGIVAIVVLATIAQRGTFSHQPEADVKDTVVVPPPVMLFGLPVDSFKIETQVVRQNQFLSEILLAKGLTSTEVDKLVRASLSSFDFRKMNSGQKFTFFLTPDSANRLKHIVYEINKIDYVHVSLNDSFATQRGKKEILQVEKTAYASIKSSLWKTIQENNLSPALAIKLSDIYAWSVDFFGIEKGDYFKVVYTEEFVDGESIGIGQIHSAVFCHHKKNIYAFHFEQDGNWDYFDEDGNSLRKAFLKAPLTFSRISSRFSNARLHPILKIRRPHHGVDYAAPSGTPVHSIGDGRVVQKGWDGKGGGNFVKITHNSVYTTVYMHLSGFASGLSAGQSVKQGQLIGYVGSTGLASGPHLDFRVFQNGKPIDPLKMESPPVEPVKPENMAHYIQSIGKIKNQLDKIGKEEEDLPH